VAEFQLQIQFQINKNIARSSKSKGISQMLAIGLYLLKRVSINQGELLAEELLELLLKDTKQKNQT